MKSIGWSFLLIAVWVSISVANDPIEVVKERINNGIALLRDPQYSSPDKKEIQREKIWETVEKAFDFTEVSARALAADWKRFTPEEQKEFTIVFTELLKNTYLDKVQGEYHNEEVVFLGQDMISEDKAVVKTKVLREKIEIPMDYSVRLKDNDWKIYDINIEGVSLVKNYRVQFKDILSKEKPAQLIQRLREKNEQHKKERSQKK